MSIETIKRIMWRLRESHPSTEVYKLKHVRNAIMYEAGVDERTVKKYIRIFKELELIKRVSRHCFIDTNKVL